MSSGNCGKWRISSGETKMRTKYGIVVQSGKWEWKVEKVESGKTIRKK
jgi:hypothetical protein